MTATPQGLLDRALRDDAARPFITFVDAATSARVELSGTTLDNWAAKTANLLRDEVGLEVGDVIFVELSHHWLSVVTLLGAWRAGATVDLVAPDGSVAAIGAPTLTTREGLPHDVFTLSEHPLGLPDSVHASSRDFVTEVRGQPDRFVPYATADPTQVILVTTGGGATGQELAAAAEATSREAGLVRGGRVLVTDALTSTDAIMAGVLAPLAAYASLVLGRNLGDPPDVGLIVGEGVTHIMSEGQPSRIHQILR